MQIKSPVLSLTRHVKQNTAHVWQIKSLDLGILYVGYVNGGNVIGDDWLGSLSAAVRQMDALSSPERTSLINDSPVQNGFSPTT